jgi:hypothetical protein
VSVINHALCVGPCRPAAHGGPRQIVAGSHLCEVCRDTFAEDLNRIADAWADLSRRLGQADGNPLSEKVDGSQDFGLVINEHVSDVIHEVTAWVWFTTRVVVDERGTGSPSERAVPALLRWLSQWHVDWLSAHKDADLAGAFAIEAHELVKTVRRTAYPSGARRIDLPVQCSEKVCEPDDGPCVPCAGRMYVMVVPDLVCSLDSTHRMTPAAWTRSSWRKHMDPAAVEALTRHIIGRAA